MCRDQDLFTEIIKENQGIIYKICNLYSNSNDSRKEMYQEIVFQLWRSFSSFSGVAKLSTWIYRVALNTAISSIRRKKRDPISEALLFEDHLQSWESPIESNENLNKLYRAISTLDDIDKGIILLYLEDRSYSEIADIIGITEKNVSVKLVRIKKRIKTLVVKYG